MDDLQTRRCEHKGCDLPAAYWLIWTRPMYLCGFHAALMAGTGLMLGYVTPNETKRALEPHEKLVHDVQQETQNAEKESR